jgi:hypothetical protein
MDHDGAALDRTEGRRKVRSGIPAPVSVRAFTSRWCGICGPPHHLVSHLQRGADKFLSFSADPDLEKGISPITVDMGGIAR